MSQAADDARLEQVRVEIDAFMTTPGCRMAVDRMIDLLNERDRLVVLLGITTKGAP